MRAQAAVVSVVALLAGAVAPAVGGESRNGRIVFQAQAGAHRQLFTINPDGTGLRQVTRLAGAEQPDWSPDGSTIAFDAPTAGGTRLFTVRPDGSGARAVPLAAGGSSGAPAFSPAGDGIAFLHSDGQIVDLHLAPLTGTGPNWTVGEPIELTELSGLDTFSRPGWFIPPDQLPALPTASPKPSSATPSASG